MIYTKYEKAHNYARANGYKGSYDEYVNLQYKGYCENCKRCDIKPMKKQQWMEHE